MILVHLKCRTGKSRDAGSRLAVAGQWSGVRTDHTQGLVLLLGKTEMFSRCIVVMVEQLKTNTHTSSMVYKLWWYSQGQSCPSLCNPVDCVSRQAPPSMGFSRQEYWSGLPFPSPGDLPHPGIEPKSPVSAR